jgi:hypothetical protein
LALSTPSLEVCALQDTGTAQPCTQESCADLQDAKEQNVNDAAQQPHDHDHEQWLQYLHEQDTHMKLNDMIESTYLKQEDVDGEKLVTVASMKKVNIARDDEDARYKWTIKFEEFAKPMAMNVTNLKRMFRFLGDDSDNWIGGKVIVYADPDVEYKGETVGGLRIKAAPRAKKPLTEDEANRKLREMEDDSSVPF